MHTTIPRAFVFAASFAVLCTAHAQPQKLRPGLWVVYGLLAVYVLCAALTPRRQAPHDLIAGTVVVPA